jgi:hypothetical protein
MNLVDIVRRLCEERGFSLTWRGGTKAHGMYQITKPSNYKPMFPGHQVGDKGMRRCFSGPSLYEDTVKANILINENEAVIKRTTRHSEEVFDFHTEENLEKFVRWLDELREGFIPPPMA